MKNGINNFVKTANQYLLFTGLIIIVGFFAYQLAKEIFKSDYQKHNSIALVDETELEEYPIELQTSFVNKYKDVFLFRVSSNRLAREDKEVSNLRKPLAMMSNSFGGYEDLETVNFLFTGASYKRTLLDKNSLILDYTFLNDTVDIDSYNRQFKLDKHLFTVVKDDTNKDKQLNRKDSIDLLASDYDGRNVTTVFSDIENYEIVDHNVLLVIRMVDEKKEATLYDLVSGAKTKIDINVPTT
ncbi:hypothetical protein [Alteromonas sp. W364]|uniref:hypothetical protein n=1 Tax=Alteromonas sp. W364 TaxID=3075610 RepID=UPI002887612B|nr:hypothetical protein [Alteromonas sp. W364]MDT0629940.1 hypothetical protein [Alteromonas sp. W364]